MMRQLEWLSTNGSAKTLAFVILFFVFLFNLTSSAAARPVNHDAFVSSSNKEQIAHLTGHTNAIATHPYLRAGHQTQKNSIITDRFNRAVGQHEKHDRNNAGVDTSFNQQYSWIKAAIKAFLVSVWTSIHTHTGALSGAGAQCS